MPGAIPIEERLRRHIVHEDHGYISPCWIWTGSLNEKGYGRIGIARKHARTHRVAYELFVAPIPGGMHIDHLCRVRSCCNPDHLEPVTLAENNRRSAPFNPVMRKGPNCKRGHPFTPENTMPTTGGRTCRICRDLPEARARRAERQRIYMKSYNQKYKLRKKEA